MRNIVCLFALLVLTTLVQAQWVQSRALSGGQINAIVTIGDRVIAGTNGGLYISDDDGDQWTAVYAGSGQQWIGAFTIDDGVVFATLPDGIYRSIDQGSTWTKIESSEIGMVGLVVRGDLMISTSFEYGMRRSTDGGSTWMATGAEITGAMDIVSVGASIIATSSYDGVYRSTDDGITWSKAAVSVREIAERGMSVHGRNVYIPAMYEGVLRSTDEGQTWSLLSVGSVTSYVYSTTWHDGYVLAGTNDPGVYRSDDNGGTWTQTNVASDRPYSDVITLGSNGRTAFAGTRDLGVFVSTDGGMQWRMRTNGILARNVIHVYVEPPNLFTFTSEGIYKASTDLTGWTESYAGLRSVRYRDGMLRLGSDLLMWGNYVDRSTDDGQTWIPSDSGLPRRAPMMDVTTVGALVVGLTLDSGLVQSLDRGRTWTQVPSPFQGAFGMVIRTRGSLWMVGTARRGIYVSSDAGATWEQRNDGLEGNQINSILLLDDETWACTDRGIHRSTNDGRYWVQQRTGLPIGWNVSDIVAWGDNVVASVYGNGIFRTTDHGATWMSISSGTPALAHTNDLAVANDRLLASTFANGLWLLDSVATSQRVTDESYQPYVRYDRMSSMLVIDVGDMRSDAVSVSMFDMLGSALISTRRPLNQRIETIDLSGLAAGVYLIRVQIGNVSSATTIVR